MEALSFTLLSSVIELESDDRLTPVIVASDGCLVVRGIVVVGCCSSPSKILDDNGSDAVV